jgi:hypothetical protein
MLINATATKQRKEMVHMSTLRSSTKCITDALSWLVTDVHLGLDQQLQAQSLLFCILTLETERGSLRYKRHTREPTDIVFKAYDELNLPEVGSPGLHARTCVPQSGTFPQHTAR